VSHIESRIPFWEKVGLGSSSTDRSQPSESVAKRMSTAAEFFCNPELRQTNLRSLFVQSWFVNAPLCFAQLDERGQINALNPRLRQMLQETGESEPSRSRFADLLDPDLKSECERLIDDMFQGKRDSFQVQSMSQNRRSRPMRWTVWRVPGQNKPDWALALVEKVDDCAENEDRLRQTMRLDAIGRLAAEVVHDFNNLLTGVLLYCDLLLASLQGHEARKYAEEIRSVSIQAASIVRQLLNVARPGTPRARLLSLNEVIEGTHELLSRLIGDNIQLRLRLDPELKLVRLDSTQAQQILLNLVLNARDAMPSGGQIVVQTANCDVEILQEPSGGTRLPCVLLIISDNGAGMNAAIRAHMFEAFFTTKGSKGTGLGLAGVRDIVSSNGGLIHVDSAPSKGTRVSVLLPIAADSSEGSSTIETSSDPQPELVAIT
jgi:two-component system, cell cycle sensor histidine kinase and response regulator CckA